MILKENYPLLLNISSPFEFVCLMVVLTWKSGFTFKLKLASLEQEASLVPCGAKLVNQGSVSYSS